MPRQISEEDRYANIRIDQGKIYRQTDRYSFNEGGVRTITSSGTLSLTDKTVICNSAVAMTVYLQAATGSGRLYDIPNIGAGRVTVEGSGSDTIDGELNQPVDQWESMCIQDYAMGTWKIL